MRCYGYSVTQSPFRIAAAVATGVASVGLAMKTGLIAHEIFSVCPSSVVSSMPWDAFYATATNCDQQVSEAFYSGASALIAAAVTTLLSLTKQPKIQATQSKTDEREGVDQAQLDTLISSSVGGSQDRQDVPQKRPRSKSLGAIPRRLAQGTHGIIVVDPSKRLANAAFRADLKAALPEGAVQ